MKTDESRFDRNRSRHIARPSSGASAHPKLVSAVPAVDGTVRAAPNEITLRFNERLEGSFSKVVIKNSEGKQVDKGDAKARQVRSPHTAGLSPDVACRPIQSRMASDVGRYAQGRRRFYLSRWAVELDATRKETGCGRRIRLDESGSFRRHAFAGGRHIFRSMRCGAGLSFGEL